MSAINYKRNCMCKWHGPNTLCKHEASLSAYHRISGMGFSPLRPKMPRSAIEQLVADPDFFLFIAFLKAKSTANK